MNESFISNSWLKRITYWDSDWNSINIEGKEKLQAPLIMITQNMGEDSKILINFSPIENADYYKIYINGTIVDSTTNLSYLYEAPKNGVYEIYIKAYNGKDYITSNKSNVIFVSVTDLGTFLIGNEKYILMNMQKAFIR